MCLLFINQSHSLFVCIFYSVKCATFLSVCLYVYCPSVCLYITYSQVGGVEGVIEEEHEYEVNEADNIEDDDDEGE